jgi:hypothetical protein
VGGDLEAARAAEEAGLLGGRGVGDDLARLAAAVVGDVSAAWLDAAFDDG